MEMNILRQREEHARALSEFHKEGSTSTHPHGKSGHRFLTPPSSDCWDTHPRAYDMGEV